MVALRNADFRIRLVAKSGEHQITQMFVTINYANISVSIGGFPHTHISNMKNVKTKIRFKKKQNNKFNSENIVLKKNIFQKEYQRTEV